MNFFVAEQVWVVKLRDKLFIKKSKASSNIKAYIKKGKT